MLRWVFCYCPQELKPRFKSSFTRNIPILIAGVVMVLVCLAQALPRFFPRFDMFQRLEWMTYDWRTRLAANWPRPYATNLLACVFITDQDLKEMNDGAYGYRDKFPWPTHYYGMLVRELARQGAKVVGFDMMFELLDPKANVELPNGTKIESDNFFASQLQQSGNVVLAADVDGNVFPADLFRTNASAVGNIFTQQDPDAVLRRAKAFTERKVWHPQITERVRPLNLDLEHARFDSDRVVFPRTDGEPPYEAPLNHDGSLRIEELTGQKSAEPQWPYVAERVWNLGLVLAARELKLDLTKATVQPDQIILRGPGSVERRIPTDRQGFFYIDWSLGFKDPRIRAHRIARLIRDDYWLHWRHWVETNAVPPFRDKVVVIGSTGTGGNIADLGATPLESKTPLVMKHLNVANSVVTGRFIHPSSYRAEWLLILLMGTVSALLSWRLRALLASLSIVLGIVLYVGLGVFLFVQYRYWLPLILPMVGALLMTHVCMVTYRVVVEHNERQRIKSVFSKVVSPNVVNELLKAEQISLGGARRKATIYFADIRGFTRMTDEIQAQAEAYIREHLLPPAVAEAYLDKQASELLATVSLYLSLIADTIKEHNGTFDKYIGDCVLAFWGAPIPNDRHALQCVRAAIDAQRAIYDLNLQRAAENKRREQDNVARLAAGQPPYPLLRLLALGSGITTGTVTVGLMGSEENLNYTVLGREVNLASRLEGVSGRGRIIISDTTYQEIRRLDPDLASRCIELPPQEIKGFRDAVKIYEVQWRQMDTEVQAYDTAVLTAARATPPTDMITPAGT